MTGDSVGARLIEAIAAVDADAIANCFAADAHFRALIPRGLREREGSAEVGSYVASWFADCTELELLDSQVDEVADRLHVSYRFRAVEEGEPYVVQQQLYCRVADGTIAAADLLCSGFRSTATSGARPS